MSKEQINFLTYTALQGQGGGGSPSNWSSYPATNNVQMSNYAVIGANRFETIGNDLSGNAFLNYQGNIGSNNKPIWQCIQTNGGGSNQPDPFTLWKGSYLKNDPSEQPTEYFSLVCAYDQAVGWIISSVWENYIAIPLTIGGSPITFSVGGNDSQQIVLSSTNGGSGRLWVDPAGALYWNSNLISPP